MIRSGARYTLPVRFTQAQVEQFAEVTGDRNPIHLDPVYAATTPFGRCIVHGFLSGSVFSRVFGTLFPGPGTIYLAQEMSFRAPAYVDEPYTAEFEVEEVRPDKHLAKVRCALLDAGGRTVIEGVARLKHDTEFIA